MQVQTDLLQADVVRPQIIETTALGAAYLAGLAVGYWNSIEELEQKWKQEHRFTPGIDNEALRRKKTGWERAVKASIAWADDR